MSIAREGWPIILSSFALAGLVALRFPWPGLALALVALFTVYFFRDPERAVPQNPRLILSPADGKVVRILDLPADHAELPGGRQISIFLSIFNVHINRAPIGGRIAKVEYHTGEFLPAFDDKASLRNEQNTVTIVDGETRIVFKQIAGLIARRIVFRKKVDDLVQAGERVGLIKFGSRTDIFLPARATVRVKVGDTVQGGLSTIGEFSE
ncbi:MAG: phosphatidylserine decarboxylase family protein [Vicinamibacteria bacterium]|jgi:phosphatidylserine decarboxylase|nr:phosphatidylserine decarboxylase family protein [Vicinamibacteria bacterium]